MKTPIVKQLSLILLTLCTSILFQSCDVMMAVAQGMAAQNTGSTYYPYSNTYTPTYSGGTYSSTTTTSSSTSSSSTTRTAAKKCTKCNGSGWYDCCSKTATFGTNASHTCSNCGQSHKIGSHSCKCKYCDKGLIR